MKIKRFAFFIVLLSLLVITVAGCQPRFQPGTYTDDSGRAVSINKIPERIVSHVPSITETLFALGLEEKVVGVSDYCDYPKEAKSKPSVGSYFNPSIESIVTLDPDLVLTGGHSESIKQLDDLGITYMVIDSKDIDGIFRDIKLLGKVAGIEGRANRLMNDMEKDVSRIVSRVKDAPRVRVFYMFDATDLNNPWTAGPGSFVDSLIIMAGGENIAAKAPSAWVQFNIEAVVDANPEIIMIDASMGTAVIALAKLREHPVWRRLTAVREGRLYLIDGDLINRPGPRIVRGLEEIARTIHPKLFE